MTKPVLYLTNNMPEAVRQLRPQALRLSLATGHGVFKSGDEFYIRLATEPEDRQSFAGLEISRFEVIGYAHPECIDRAKAMIR